MNAAVAKGITAQAELSIKSERMVSLDVFRGLTIAGMILVNNPGSWSYVYPPLAHAEWNGWTPTDLIFPFFLFIVGVAITLSLGGKVERGTRRRAIITGVLRRSAILFALGLFLASFPFFNNWSTIRIPGVLQRIAICFLCASLVFLTTSVRGQALIALLLLAAYWALMKLVPVPAGYAAEVIAMGGNLEKEANLAAYVDNLLLHGHLWRQTKTWDPEGVLSTIPAIATVILGMLAGHWLKSNRSLKEKIAGMIAAGALCAVAGQVMNFWFPINKNLWTSSYVVFSAGLALLLLALCFWVIDYKGHKRVAWPFVVFGVNAISVFVLSGMVARVLALVKVGPVRADGSQVSLQRSIYDNLFASWAGPMNGSLAYAIAFVLIMFMPMLILYRRKIFIKV